MSCVSHHTTLILYLSVRAYMFIVGLMWVVTCRHTNRAPTPTQRGPKLVYLLSACNRESRIEYTFTHMHTFLHTICLFIQFDYYWFACNEQHHGELQPTRSPLSLNNIRTGAVLCTRVIVIITYTLLYLYTHSTRENI